MGNLMDSLDYNKKRITSNILGDIYDKKFKHDLEELTKNYIETIVTTFGKDYNMQDLKSYIFDLILCEITEHQIKEAQSILCSKLNESK